MLKFNPSVIKKEAKEKVEKAGNLEELKSIYKEYLGKKGKVTDVFNSIRKLSKKEKIKMGRSSNLVKSFIEKIVNEKKRELANEVKEEGFVDITIPGKRIEIGSLHPLTLVKRKVENIFRSMGFSIAEGPHIENEWYNFDSLNIPKDHPARDSWDTFWLKGKANLLLRTHTSPVQVRYMEKNNPPLRIISPGFVFRHEASDAAHDIQFYQIEGLMIDKDVSLADLKGVVENFLDRLFEKKFEIRWRPGFFPFVEPGLEIDIKCSICGGKGCKACKRTGWIEVMGAGMVHPNVLKAAKLNPKLWQGFAFGFGFDRLVMVKHKIDDVRLFYSGDLRFLKQF